MKMPDGLPGHDAARVDRNERLLLGETGFSFPRTRRPAAPLAPWAHGDVPEAARAALRADDTLADLETLSYVPLERDALGETDAEWILGRTAAGLLSIVVRDARHAEAAQLREDTAFALAEARRLHAMGAIVFVQDTRGHDLARCLDAMRDAFAVAAIEPGRLQTAAVDAALPVRFCCLIAA